MLYWFINGCMHWVRHQITVTWLHESHINSKKNPRAQKQQVDLKTFCSHELSKMYLLPVYPSEICTVNLLQSLSSFVSRQIITLDVLKRDHLQNDKYCTYNLCAPNPIMYTEYMDWGSSFERLKWLNFWANAFRLFKRRSRLLASAKRVVDYWNALSNNIRKVVETRSVNSFMARIDKHCMWKKWSTIRLNSFTQRTIVPCIQW